jgi:hypothetical protein
MTPQVIESYLDQKVAGVNLQATLNLLHRTGGALSSDDRDVHGPITSLWVPQALCRSPQALLVTAIESPHPLKCPRGRSWLHLGLRGKRGISRRIVLGPFLKPVTTESGRGVCNSP